jgi:arylsulfatase A-like enzyme
MRMYDDSWEGPHLIWPPYVKGGLAAGVLDERQARQVRACYGAKLTMIDAWFGQVLDAIDRNNMWNDTAVFVCTDHGHYLGEKDIWGKPGVPVYNTLGHIPLMVAWPGATPGTTQALSTNVDIFATLVDLFGAKVRHRTHGMSLLPVIRGESQGVRDHALAGVWGREVHIIDADEKYARGRSRRTSRCRCGRTAGRRCRSTAIRKSGCRCRTTGRTSIACRDRRCR